MHGSCRSHLVEASEVEIDWLLEEAAGEPDNLQRDSGCWERRRSVSVAVGIKTPTCRSLVRCIRNRKETV